MSVLEPINTHEFPIEHAPVEDWQRIESEVTATATAGFADLGSIAGVDFGLWEMSAGAMRDIEGDEVFIVISGTGRIEFHDSERPDYHLKPGVLVRLEEGAKTHWYVDEAPLRKLFIAPAGG